MNPRAVGFLLKNRSRINWLNFSRNSGAFEYLRAHPELVSWEYMHVNPHPNALEFIEAHGKLDPNLVKARLKQGDPVYQPLGPDVMFQKNTDWYAVSANPSIFV
jgi:hypothetical protein